jgi:hypothetical protein
VSTLPEPTNDDDETTEWCITPRDALATVRRFAVAESSAYAAGVATVDARRVRHAVAQADDILGARRRIAQAEQRDDDAIDLALAQMMLSFACAFLPREGA